MTVVTKTAPETGAPIDPLCECLLNAVLPAAYTALFERFKVGTKDLEVHEKTELDGTKSIVTAGDWQSQNTLEAIIKAQSKFILSLSGLDPNMNKLNLVMEEDPGDLKKRDQGLTFLADPIDGTIIYSRKVFEQYGQIKNSNWAVLTALELNRAPLAVAVYVATANEGGSGQSPNPAHGLGGSLFVARKNSGCFRIDPPPGGFRLFDGVHHDFSKAFAPKSEQTTWPRFNLGDGSITRLDHFTPLTNDTLEIAQFLSDQKRFAPNASTDEDGLRALFEDNRLTQSFSAVASACRVVNGDAGMFTYGACFPWDCATKLLLSEAGVAVVELAVPQSPDESRTLLLTGRDKTAFAMALEYITSRERDIVTHERPALFRANFLSPM